MKIAICMFYDDKIKEFSDINRSINAIYCKKHNIDLIVSNKIKNPHRKPHWERIYLILEHLSKYDYMVWIDSDAFFYENSKHIMEIIKEHDTPFIFSRDRGSSCPKPPLNIGINSGVFIVKNSQYCIDFLKKWGYDEDIHNYALEMKRWHDQEGLLYMFEHNIMDIKDNSTILDYGVLQHFNIDDLENKPYIFHAAGKNNDIRIQMSQFYLKKIKQKYTTSYKGPYKMFLF